MDKKIYVSSSPHFNLKCSTQMIMGTVLFALLPEIIMGIVLFRWAALIRILVSVASCVLFEFLFQKATKQKVVIANLSACVTGVMMALVCPPTAPVWIFVVGAAIAMVVAKGLFGGIGSNVFNPALTGRAFMFLSFPAAMGASWLTPKTLSAVDAVSSATTLSAIKAGTFVIEDGTLWQYFIGNRAGCIGETSTLLILISFIFLALARIIDWRAPFAMVGTVAVCSLIAGENVAMSLMTGGLMFGATFMVTDYATAPITKKGRFIFGFGCGLITFLIRRFGGYPEGVMFSILIMNSVAPFLNNLTARKYGYGKKAGRPANADAAVKEAK
ncbi:MAG: RnfABCDGE type electron transport complex subunit D [Treponema sp.]|nr:RnfABCDGE type electron transport complex subunit D [Treponema sp.]